MSARVKARFLIPLLVLIAAACGGDEKPREPLAPPPVSPNLIVHGQGNLALEVGSNATQSIDPATLASAAGSTAPCGKLVILVSWRTEDNKSLLFTSKVESGDVKVGEGADGVASISGCGIIGAKNDGGGSVTGELRYVVAETR